MKHVILKILIALSFLSGLSCSQEKCVNRNPILENTKPETQEYKTALVYEWKKAVEAGNSITINLDSYEKIDGQHNLQISLHGDSLCAKATILVLKPDEQIKGLIAVNGKGYRGAELKNLTIYLDKNTEETVFVYKSIDRIID